MKSIVFLRHVKEINTMQGREVNELSIMNSCIDGAGQWHCGARALSTKSALNSNLARRSLRLRRLNVKKLTKVICTRPYRSSNIYTLYILHYKLNINRLSPSCTEEICCLMHMHLKSCFFDRKLNITIRYAYFVESLGKQARFELSVHDGSCQKRH